MNKYTLEMCVDSVESAINAQKGGATRLELCSNLIIGGTTPTKSLFEEVRKNVNIPINVLIRPRFGDFLYSKYEIEIIKNEIRMFREMGADGIVVGILTKEGEIDLENMKSFISEAQDIPVTFHRAFDELKKIGVKAILTSGQEENCLKGKQLLKKLVELSNKDNKNKIEIIVGAGLNILNIEEIKNFTGANNFHFSGKKVRKSGMEYKKQDINMGIKGFSEFEILETDEKIVQEVSEYLKKTIN